MAEESKIGRLKVRFLDILNFTTGVGGKPPVTPIDGEVAYDYESDDITVARVAENGNVVLKSTTKDLKQRFAQLEASGVFDNAEAFVLNRKIYRMYYDQNRQTVRLDPELRFEPLYRYYAIRHIEKNSDGNFSYLTGVKAIDGSGATYVVSNLVDLDLVPSESGDDSKVSKPAVGALMDVMYDGKNYAVEFYDKDRYLVNIIPFQAIAVKLADFDMTPDNAVVDMYVNTNRPNSDDGSACFIYQNESISNLDIRVFLKYADGRVRDVTHEMSQGGKLVLEGLSEIKSDVVTQPTDVPQKFTVRYFMIMSNAIISGGATPSGAAINPTTLSISKDINVYIKEDVYDVIEKIVPAASIVGNLTSGEEYIDLKMFGHYRSGVVRDITNFVQVNTKESNGTLITFNKKGIGLNQEVIVKVPQGHGEQFKIFSFMLWAPYNARYCVIDAADESALRLIAANPGSSLSSSQFTSFRLGSSLSGVTLEQLKALMKYNHPVRGEIIPTHFRVRSITDSRFLYTAYESAIPCSYLATQGKELTRHAPLLVEFMKITTNTQGVITEVFFTGAMVHYAELASV